ncbi:flavin reductase family protein [Dysosmobacter sp.]|uniref:flavin reductase family protein n=1 Tax=Dysosmobacter sp. TaxID=2591382 RepID=UPI002A8A2C18|nr:flavin reductase [Dysosmobacter sp.]MDY3985412.1 flavin reductase [Dysosmobacter sp.]
MDLRPADLRTMTPEVFRVFGIQNALLTAGDRTGCNTMTIGWCQLGRLWGLNTCTVYVRPERYTYQFMEDHDYFTVSVLPLSHKQTTMQVCGTQSGRDLDKIKTCGLTLRYGAGEAPFFDEAEWVLVCKKLYAQDMTPECVKDERIFQSYTPAKGGWHRLYVGEVLEAYQK